MPSLGDSVERRIEFVSRIEALAGPLGERPVLDLGCGRHALWSRAYAARGARVVGLELDPARCREAVARLAASPPAPPGRMLGVLRGNGEHLPLASASVVFVHCAQVLEHVASPRAFLAELRRVLAPGGHAYLTAINRFAFRDPHFGVRGVNWMPRTLGDRVLGWLGAENPEGGQSLARMHYFTRAGFRRLCAGTGLELVADLKRAERRARHGAVGAWVATAWGDTVRSAAFHLIVRRPR